jgi:hypothetical protein
MTTFWDWDLQLLKTVVSPWPSEWPAQLCDLRALVDEVGLVPPSNVAAHHPRSV